jgi:hypothetical protein
LVGTFFSYFTLDHSEIIKKLFHYPISALRISILHFRNDLLSNLVFWVFRSCGETHGTISDGQLGRIHASTFEHPQNFPPTLGRLAHLILYDQEMLLTTRIYANNNKGAQLVTLAAQATVGWTDRHRLAIPGSHFLGMLTPNEANSNTTQVRKAA